MNTDIKSMKLNYKRTICVGFAFFSICAFWQVYDSVVPLILKDTFDLNDAISGVIMAMDNILALFLLPFFGALSDRTHTRLGRRMPFILIGTLCAVGSMMLLPLADHAELLWLFLVGLGLTLLSMSVYRSPAVALMPDVTPKPLRSRGNAVINLMGAVGGILSLAAIGLMIPKTARPNYFPLFAFTGGLMLVSLIILLRTVNEPKLAAQMQRESGLDDAPAAQAAAAGSLPKPIRRSLYLILASVFLWFMGYNAITTSFSKYAHTYWGLTGGSYAYTLMIAQAAAILSYIPVGMVASRIGRRRTILIGVALLAVAFGSCIFFKRFSVLIFFFFVLAGIGWASINVNSYPMVVELSGGGDVGKYTGYYYTASQAAQTITPILSGFVLEYGHLLLGSADPDAGYVLLFPYGALFVAASFVTMCFVRHGDAAAKPVDALELYAQDDQ